EVRAAVALQNVAIVGTYQSLDVRQNVAGRVRNSSRPIVQTYVHRCGRARVRRDVEPAAAVQRVRTGTALQRVVAATGTQVVVAGPAIEQVSTTVALQNVREVGTYEALDVRQNVAGSVSAGSRAVVQAHVHCRGRACVRRDVQPAAAVQCVGPCSALQRVVAGLSEESVIAAAAGHSVLTIAPLDRIVTRPAPRTALFPYTTLFRSTTVALQNVREVGTDESLDVRQNVAGRVSAGSRAV